jgi:hypothetical protein
MNDYDSFQKQPLKKIQLYLYLVPIIGFFPAFYTLYRREADRDKKAVSRLSVTLMLTWLMLYGLLSLGSSVSSNEFLAFRLMFLNALTTSGYFLLCFGLMIRLWQGKLPRLPGIKPINIIKN